MTADEPDTSMRCIHCQKAGVVLIPADPVYHDAHWMCPECDSTYDITRYIATKAELNRLRAELADIRGELAESKRLLSKVDSAAWGAMITELAEAKKNTARLSAISKADRAMLNELADCYFLRRCEGLLELMMRADRRTTERNENNPVHVNMNTGEAT